MKPCALHPETSEKFGLLEFLHKLSDHLKVNFEEASLITKAVFNAVKAQLSPKEVEDAASQLPQELKEIWGPPEFQH